MPPLVDPTSGAAAGAGGFIPPPPGVTQGGQAYNAFPGAGQPGPGWTSAPPTTWTSPWLAAQQFQQPPPATSHSWTYPSHPSPYTSWTPPGSWGTGSPAQSWGLATPPSANVPAQNFSYVPQHHSTPPTQESALGHPPGASPWSNGGGDPSHHPAFGPAGSPGGPWASNKNGYPVADMQRTPSREHAAPGFVGGFGLKHTTTPRRSRTTSSNLKPFSLEQQLQAEEYTSQNLARRPRDWRPDYDPRAGLASFIPRVARRRSDVVAYNDPQKRTLHPYLAYKANLPPVFVDIRYEPNLTLEFPQILQAGRVHNHLDLAQLATQPAAQDMRLFHPLLPWYIDITAYHENGITIHDVIRQLFMQLDVPIQARHWFNEELDDSIREKMNREFEVRAGGNPAEIGQGVKRVDFLRGRVFFEGLAKSRNGLWEIKMRRWDQ
ncbi:hypothetical protein H0H81_003751 [Sphagnurus paluster]|uniref:DUF6699 domain-containing protein n=1 Tax=Sphagnurus paluster TaxID=117069 RepID=A0A9P7GR56_9AGAR|nr:hypothetical protein H0H81_003751 [Sphagnurus paluster]